MTKKDFIRNISEYTEGLTHAQIGSVLNAIAPAVVKGLTDPNAQEGEKVPIPGTGAFQIIHVSERSGVSKLLGDEKPWTVPAHDEITFKISKYFKRSLMEE